MRTRRHCLVDKTRPQFFHVVSRVVDRRRIFGDVEKEYFRKWMRKLAGFTGVEVVAYCVMGNHFHLLLHVPTLPPLESLGEDEVWKRLEYIHPRNHLEEMKAEIAAFREAGRSAEVSAFFQYQRSRMYDLSKYVRELKIRFSKWYNQRHERHGTLWEERFRATLVEGSRHCLMVVGSYIELNPVRAGMVSDPKDYRWCSFAEAAGGSEEARKGIQRLTATAAGPMAEEEALASYRMTFMRSGAGDRSGKASIDGERLNEVLARNGKLSLVDALHCRIRYFCDGLVLGGAEFVQDFQKRMEESGKPGIGRKRRTSQPMRFGEWDELHVYRDLRKDVIMTPTIPDLNEAKKIS